MSDEGKLYDAISRASQVSALLENGELDRALDEMKAELIEKWMQSPVKDVIGREKLHMEITILHKFRGHLRNVLDHGKMAQVDLNTRSRRGAA